MIHYTCDRCKNKIDSEQELRYVVNLEIQASFESVEAEELVDEKDHLLALQDILNELDEDDSDLVGDDVYQKHRFDLCKTCYQRYAKNPLGIDTSVQIGFSEN